jgi:hypothetical protein
MSVVPAPVEPAPAAGSPAPSASPVPWTEEQRARLSGQLDAVEQAIHPDAGSPPPAAALKGSVQCRMVSAPSAIVDAERTVAGMRPGMRACFNRAMAKEGRTFGGNVTLTLVMDGNGSVTTVTASASDSLPEALLGCVKARAHSAQFQARGVTRAELQVQCTFSPVP